MFGVAKTTRGQTEAETGSLSGERSETGAVYRSMAVPLSGKRHKKRWQIVFAASNKMNHINSLEEALRRHPEPKAHDLVRKRSW